MIEPIYIDWRGVPPTATAQQKGVSFHGGHAHFFEKASVRSAREVLMAAFRPFVPSAPISTPVTLTAAWVFPWRKSEKKSVVSRGVNVPCPTRPDLDNLEKLLLDVLAQMGFIADDSLVWSKATKKMRGPCPGIFVMIVPDLGGVE